jgi:hypothetical protein
VNNFLRIILAIWLFAFAAGAVYGLSVQSDNQIAHADPR